MNFRHVVITRFSVHSPHAPGRNKNEAWLRERLELFTTVCVPGLQRQSAAFTWMVLVGDQAPRWLLDHLDDSLRGMNAEVLRMGDEWEPELRDHLAYAAGDDALVTTRLDSDDSLAPSFLQVVQAMIRPEIVVNAPSGARLELPSGRAVLLHSKRTFETLCSTEGRNALEFKHGTLRDAYPSVQTGRNPLWLQTIHSTNIANRSMKGKPVRSLPGFPWVDDLVRPPTPRERLSWVKATVAESRLVAGATRRLNATVGARVD
jgi:hypothetical protein